MSSDTSDSIQRRLGETTFIEPNGGLLTEQLIQKLRNEKCSENAAQPKTFQYPDDPPSTTSELEAHISDAWDDLEERWDEVTRDNELFGMEVSEARRRWILKLFDELGFDPEYQQANLSAGEIEANLSHFGWPRQDSVTASQDTPDATPPVLHTIRPDGDHPLDDGDHRGAIGRQQSPHDELQRYLNATDDVQWSVVTDGLKLRVLRDYYHTYTRGYVEFDLENIFTNRNYDDFRALYRVCHASRFIPRGDGDDAESSLESLYQVALATGVKVGEDLQSNVVEALETLGNGFFNKEIREALEEGGQEEAEAYYQDLLRIVYRLLFLLFAEQRGMMADRGALYTKEYSISALRERAERKQSRDHQTDLWEGLKITFRLVGQGVDKDDLHVPGYNGGLFDDEKLEFVQDAACNNDAILSAIHNLTHVEQQGYQQRISYADLGVDEIGAVYESLLEFTPQLADTALELDDRSISRGQFYLDDRGMERKETGSYYTKPELVDELIESALKPVVNDRLGKADTKEEKEEALLDIDVCDPAVGSGAFLIAANNYLGKRLAEIRSDSAYPDEATVRRARRSVVQHCLYGVDLNPMAVELAKVSLWINSAVEDQPLSFLDHRIKQGNSLVGTNSELLEQGIPVDAFETSKGRDGHVGNEIRKKVRSENKSLREDQQLQSGLDWSWERAEEYVETAKRLEDIPERNINDIEKKKQLYEEVVGSTDYKKEKLAFDVWTAAFYWPLDGTLDQYPTPSKVEQIRREGLQAVDSRNNDLVGFTQSIADEESFFHWELEFPTVFLSNSSGFDCVLGNPPWERNKLEEREFFATAAPKIAATDKKSDRQDLIDELEEEDPDLYHRYQMKVKRKKQRAKFLRESGRYPLTAQGDLNYYPLFAESNRDLLGGTGRTGIVVPSGIATDYYTQEFFRDIIESRSLVSLFDFENREALFPGIDNRMKFSLLTISGPDLDVEEADFAFFMTNINQLYNPSRHFNLSPEDLEIINPNTKTCPLFRKESHADLTLKLHNSAPVLLNKTDRFDPWGISFNQMFHMSNDSSLLNETEGLSGGSFDKYNRYQAGSQTFLPVYEGKMVDLYDHRHSTIELTDNVNRSAQPKKIEDDDHQNPNFIPGPLYWIAENEIKERVPEEWPFEWVGTFKRVTSPTNHRTVVGTIIPKSAISYTLVGTHTSITDPQLISCLYANMWSIPFDFVVRQKLNQPSLPQYVIEQTPTITPNEYGKQDIQFIIPRVLELIYTSWDQATFADDIWHSSGPEVKKEISQRYQENGIKRENKLEQSGRPDWIDESEFAEETIRFSPFIWDIKRRENIQAELDAYFGKKYGLTRGNLSEILDSFNTVRKNDISSHGEFRTKKLILSAYDRITEK